MKKSKHKFHAHYIYYIFYGVGFIGAAVLGLLSASFFAYEITDYLWTHILYVLFISMLYITAFVQELAAHRKPKDIVYYSAMFLGTLLFFLLMYFLGGIAMLCAVLYSGVLLGVIFFKAIIKTRRECDISDDVDVKIIISVMSLIIFVMASMMTVDFEDEMYMAWSLIPAAAITVILCVAAVILLRGLWGAVFPTMPKKIGMTTLYIIGIFAVAFVLSFTTVGVANVVADTDKPEVITCKVLDKQVRSASRTPTRYEIKVVIGKRKEWINVDSGDYYRLNKGDAVMVDRYAGALGFAYYIYGGVCDEQP